MRVVVFLIIFLVCAGANAADNIWLRYITEAENALQTGDLSSARNDLLQALLEVQKSANVSAQDADLNKLFSNIETWKQADEKKMKEASELQMREQQSQFAQQAEQSKQEVKAFNARWQIARAQGKTYAQFSKEEQGRNRPEKLARFQKSLADGRSLVKDLTPPTKEHLEILKLAASVRKSVYGPQDTVALEYDKAVKGDEALLQQLAGVRSLFEQKDPKKFMKAGITPDAKDTFETAFLTPISQNSELKGGGYAWLDYDAWVRFKSPGAVELKEQNGFSKVSSEEAVKKFLSVCPQDRAALSETANLECIQGKRIRKDLVGGRLLLSNKKRKLYWYRTWH